MSKPPTAAERRHLNRIGEMNCLVCGREAAVHHITSNGYARITRSHRLVAPLCPECHQYGPHAVHVIGHREFCILHGIDLYQWAGVEWDKSQALEKNKLTTSLIHTYQPYPGDAA